MTTNRKIERQLCHVCYISLAPILYHLYVKKLREFIKNPYAETFI